MARACCWTPCPGTVRKEVWADLWSAQTSFFQGMPPEDIFGPAAKGGRAECMDRLEACPRGRRPALSRHAFYSAVTTAFSPSEVAWMEEMGCRYPSMSLVAMSSSRSFWICRRRFLAP